MIRRTHSLGKNQMTTILDKQGKEFQEQDIYAHGTNRRILLRIIRQRLSTDNTNRPGDIPPIMAWEESTWTPSLQEYLQKKAAEDTRTRRTNSQQTATQDTSYTCCLCKRDCYSRIGLKSQSMRCRSLILRDRRMPMNHGLIVFIFSPSLFRKQSLPPPVLRVVHRCALQV